MLPCRVHHEYKRTSAKVLSWQGMRKTIMCQDLSRSTLIYKVLQDCEACQD